MSSYRFLLNDEPDLHDIVHYAWLYRQDVRTQNVFAPNTMDSSLRCRAGFEWG